MRAVLASPPPTLLVIAKAPVAGRVKTRLTPPYSPQQAAALAEAALADTLHTLGTVPAGRRLLVLDGAPGRWLPPGWQVVPQVGGGLDARLTAAFGHAPAGAPALLVGMDTPQLSAQALAAPLSAAERRGADAWYGPAADGGFWALGLARPSAELAGRLLMGVPMSTPHTGEALLQRLADAGLRVHRLPELTDVDTAADARQVAAQAPAGRFAACWREVTQRAAVTG
ncbi:MULTISPECIES: TIGR04282 family arsenosugar biosynthesis glycosyltransferase [unclassified Kitasatospora]|uniref:TIGR04282 family arsenosugar biosynthesis glycosyltransferase n=1 Tax=unclassified Kitasatospora TaxID=2633591 RepID=UPI002473A618|nr:glycosyltransferase [Kitasatospora sp. MAP12-44]